MYLFQKVIDRWTALLRHVAVHLPRGVPGNWPVIRGSAEEVHRALVAEVALPKGERLRVLLPQAVGNLL